MALPATMKGLQIVEFKKPYRLSHNIPVPKIERDNEVLIKVVVAGYCHTEIMVQNGGFEKKMRAAGRSLPLIPSHECSGIVAAIGSGVKNLKVGDRVAAPPIKNPCGRCADCEKGLDKYCESADHCGVFANGAAAQYMVADSRWSFRLPPQISFETAAPLMCAGATIYSGLKTANLKPGQTVAIIGAGALGHLGVQFAKCMGLKVVAVDSRQAPLDLVKSLKYPPDFAIDATKGVEFALQQIGGMGVDATLMATDSLAAHEYGLGLTRKHGTFVVIGIPLGPIPVHYKYLIFNNLTIRGSVLCDAEGIQEMLNLVAQKGVEVKTQSYPLHQFETLISNFHKESHAGKLVLRIANNDKGSRWSPDYKL